MAERRGIQTITSTSNQQKSVPVVTVESFYNSHAEKLQMKLEGPRVGFHRKIREPTINRPGLALSGFYTYFAEKRVQVLGAAEYSYLKSLSSSCASGDFERCASTRFRAWWYHADFILRRSAGGRSGRQKSRCFARR